MNKLIIITGATATGKTQTSIEIAQHLNSIGIKSSVVNFDSLLFYKEISIGSAKPSIPERQGIDHHLIDIASINSSLTAHDFIKLAEIKINELHKKNELPILVGGSAFYLRALIKGMYAEEDTDIISKEKKKNIQIEIENLYQKNGITFFLDFLKDNDPESLNNYHQNDHYRIMRAVEYFKLTGQKISDQKTILDQKNPYDLSSTHQNWDFIHFNLHIPKDEHLSIIQQRTKKMLDLGLVDEVLQLKTQGFTYTEKPLQSIGYKETLQYLKGELKTIEELTEKIFISTRQLAKSQKTFFKKIIPKIVFNPITDHAKIISTVKKFLDN